MRETSCNASKYHLQLLKATTKRVIRSAAGENERLNPAHSSCPTNTVCSGGGVFISVSINSPLAINEMCQNSVAHAGL